MAKGVRKNEAELPANVGEISIQQVAEQMLVKFNITDQKIAELKQDYGKLLIYGADDKESYKVATTALSTVKNLRTGVEAKRKELKQPFWDAGVAIDAEAKRITAELTPIENHLASQIKKVDDELLMRKRAEETRRIQLLTDAGFNLIGQTYQVGRVGEFFDKIMEQDEVWLQSFLDAGRAERDRLEEERKLQQEQEQKLAKEREELEALRQELAEKEAALRAKEQPLQQPGVLPFNVVPDPTLKNDEVRFVQGDTPDWVKEVFPTTENVVLKTRSVGMTETPVSIKSAYFNDGWQACKTRIIKVFTEDQTPRKRAEWVEIFKNLQP